MFNIGDKVVYPMHGAGVIEAIEEKEVMGKKQQYYIMKMPLGQMQVMIPLEKVSGIGLRQIIDQQEVDQVFDFLQEKEEGITVNWNRRYRVNLEKMKSGDVYQLAEVVRSLSLRDREKKLSSGEKKMLENARQILISELVLAINRDEDEVSRMVDRLFG